MALMKLVRKVLPTIYTTLVLTVRQFSLVMTAGRIFAVTPPPAT